jgi:integrase
VTTFKHPRGKTYRYDFWWRGKRHTGTTGQLTKKDADAVEADIKKRVRQEAFGIAPFDRMRTPSFHRWASVRVEHLLTRDKAKRPEQLKSDLRTALCFFGRKPQRAPDLSKMPAHHRPRIERRLAAAPYHDLRLADPITHPEWIERFEDWMSAEQMSGAMKNHLRSAMSGLYRTALLPAFRSKSNVTANPFLNIDRDDVFSRERILTQGQLWGWVAAAAPHARVAMAIAAYAPKLRSGVILELEWREHLDPELKRIVVQRHKARGKKKRPQVVLIPNDLRVILEWWRKKHPRTKYVVTYRDEPVGSLKVGLRAAIKRANKELPDHEQMTYGAKNGVTFHTIRHTMATMLAEMGIPERLRQAVMDQTAETIEGYTHTAPAHEKKPLEQLARRLRLVDAVQGKVQGAATATDENTQGNAARPGPRRRNL